MNEELCLQAYQSLQLITKRRPKRRDTWSPYDVRVSTVFHGHRRYVCYLPRQPDQLFTVNDQDAYVFPSEESANKFITDFYAILTEPCIVTMRNLYYDGLSKQKRLAQDRRWRNQRAIQASREKKKKLRKPKPKLQKTKAAVVVLTERTPRKLDL